MIFEFPTETTLKEAITEIENKLGKAEITKILFSEEKVMFQVEKAE